MDQYTVTFWFIENGHECKTSWGGPARSKADAIKTAREWFGFDKDGIEVTKVRVNDEEV